MSNLIQLTLIFSDKCPRPICWYQISNNVLLPGNIRRFRRICEHAQSVVSVVRRPQQLPPASPRAQRRSVSATTTPTTITSVDGKDSLAVPTMVNNVDLISDSSSCNSDLSERIQYIPIPGPGSAEKSNLSTGDKGAIRHQVNKVIF